MTFKDLVTACGRGKEYVIFANIGSLLLMIKYYNVTLTVCRSLYSVKK